MHGPSNLDHPPAMEETGEDLLLHGWDPEDVTKRGNFEIFFGRAGAYFPKWEFRNIFKITGGRDYLSFQEGI